MVHTDIRSLRSTDLETVLVGRSIKALASQQKLVLSDGTELHLHDTTTCCSHFDGWFSAIHLSDAVITGVRREERAPRGGRSEAFSFVVLSGDTELLALDIEGSFVFNDDCDQIDDHYASVDLRVVAREAAEIAG